MKFLNVSKVNLLLKSVLDLELNYCVWLVFFLSDNLINKHFFSPDNLTNLIESAHLKGVMFVYAISPGLDICFSNSKDVQALKRKLEQVCLFFLKTTDQSSIN